MIIDCISEIPPHYCLYITHNDHRSGYESIENYVNDLALEIDDEELQKMKELDSIWEVQLYPYTPVSSHWTAAATLERAVKLMKMNYKDGKWL